MKAKNIEDPDVNQVTVQEQASVEEVAPLLKPAELKNIFKEINTKTDHFTEYALDIVVESNETLLIAENNSSELQEILKNIESVRKIRKDPYYKTGQLIDEFAKNLRLPLEQAKDKIIGAITNYKRIQEATARIESQKVIANAEAVADLKAEEADKMHRIHTQMNARMYGGWWMNKDNVRKSSAGCIKPEDCTIVLDIVINKVPKSDTLVHMAEEYDEMLKTIKKNISEHQANLINLSSDSKTLREDAQKSINEAKMRAGIKTEEKKAELTEEIVKNAKKEIKEAEKEVKEAGKGVRKTLKFEVTDFDKVPRKFLTLDEVKVRAWVAEHKDEVKQKITDGEVIIDGLNFFLEDAFISR